MRGRLILVACPRGAVESKGGLWACEEGSFWVYNCMGACNDQSKIEELLDGLHSGDRIILTEAYFFLDSRSPSWSKFIKESNRLLRAALAQEIDVVLVSPKFYMIQKFWRERADCMLEFHVSPDSLGSIIDNLLESLGERVWDFVDKEKLDACASEEVLNRHGEIEQEDD